MDAERWLPVVGWEGVYEVSDHGSVARILSDGGRRALKHCISRKTGYHRVCLCRNNVKVSRNVAPIVCEAFRGPRPDGCEAAHGNGSKDDNSAKNVTWKTHKENEADKRVHGTLAVGQRNGKHTKPWMTPVGERHWRSVLNEEQVIAIRAHEGVMSQRRTAEKFGISKTNVADIWRRHIWKEVA